jgi:anti-sigma regulatory factor (Ser/Thr protein kinase)
MSTVLVVDRATLAKGVIQRILANSTGHQPVFVDSAEGVIEAVTRQMPDAVLLNPVSADLDGPGLVRTIHDRYPQVPVILITTKGSEAVAIRAFAHGAANYVPRHLIEKELAGTLRTVLQASQQKRREMQLLERMTDFHCVFELENDRNLLPSVVSYLQEHLGRLRLCDESVLIRAGIALDEALVNALCHGNLELDSSLRETDPSSYEQQAVERAAVDPYRSRRIHVKATITKDQAEILIRDEGPGFNPAFLPDPTDLENMDKVSGRGVHLMRSFMDEVRYNDQGNCVTLILKSRPCA